MNYSSDSNAELYPETSLFQEDERVSLAEEAVLFYLLPELQEIATHDRLESILQSIAANGSYTHTPTELQAGAQLAWRNQPRCIGRYNWRSLEVIDARSCVTANEVAEACWDHLRISTNRGKLRSVVTIFRPYRGPASHVQILNSQLIRYACYESADGGIVGDPQQVELTRTAMSLGWRGAGGPFDVLPLIISVDGNPPEMFDVPADHVLEVSIRHPRYPWFSELGLRWHANPAISKTGWVAASHERLMPQPSHLLVEASTKRYDGRMPTEPNWLDPREDRAWRAFTHAQRQLSLRLHRHLLQDSGLTEADYVILAALSEHPAGRMPAQELCASLEWEKSRLSHQVRRVEHLGLIAREPNPADARSVMICLLPAGRRAIEDAAPDHVRNVRRHFIDLFTPAELDVLATLSARVLCHLAEEPFPGQPTPDS